MSEKSPLQKARAEARANGFVYLLENRVVPTVIEDARALSKALSDLNREPADKGTYGADPWVLAKTYQSVEGDVTDNALRRHALPELIKAFDIGIDLGADTDYLLLTLHTFLLGRGRASSASPTPNRYERRGDYARNLPYEHEEGRRTLVNALKEFLMGIGNN